MTIKRGPGGLSPIVQAAFKLVGVDPNGWACTIDSSVPPGSSTGTSAAVAVAALGALHLFQGEQVTPRHVATEAWRLETEVLRRQSGVQDQVCSAFGGISLIRILDYPSWDREAIAVGDKMRKDLETGLCLVTYGGGHDSSALHERVIRHLEKETGVEPIVNTLRACAEEGVSALRAGNLHRFGRAMIANNKAQFRLHADLVPPFVTNLTNIAEDHGAVGWKVNGAGGPGGSLCLLFDSPQNKQNFLEAASEWVQDVPIQFASFGLLTA